MVAFPEIEGYEITDEVGRGEHGVVYKAVEVAADRVVALKVLSGKIDGRTLKRFAQEANIGKLLARGDVARVYASGEGADGAWIAMEFIDGCDLRGLIDSVDFGVDARVEALSLAALALHHAHQQNVIHRDIKPSNIFVKRDGGVCLLDFGIAKLQNVALTLPGMVVGSPGYLSPEQAKGEAPDARTDVFALGLVGFELLTQNIPWNAKNITQLIAVRATQPPKQLREQNLEARYGLDVPSIELLHRIIHRSIQQDPAQRQSSALELATELQGYLRRLDAVDSTGARKVPKFKIDPEGWRKQRVRSGQAGAADLENDSAESMTLLWVAAGVVLAMIGLGLWLISGR